MFKNFLNTYASHENVNFKILASKTEGYSSSDIRNICREACMGTVRKTIHQINGKFSFYNKTFRTKNIF